MYEITYTVRGYDMAMEEYFFHQEVTFEYAMDIYEQYAKFNDIMDLVILINTHSADGTESRVYYPSNFNK